MLLDIMHENMSPYALKLECPTVDDFCRLRAKAGWGDTDKTMAQKSLENSLFHVVIYLESTLIGMGRVVGDGAMYFYIQDVVIDPNYQQKGLGHSIMEKIEAYLLKNAKQGATVGLLAAKGKEAFYARYGYLQRPNAALGHGMCKFI